MVRVGAKRERPCLVILHVALRTVSSARDVPSPQQQQHRPESRKDTAAAAAATPSSPSEHLLCHSPLHATLYANAVLLRLRVWWELLGGVRYGLPDAVRLASAVWDDAAALAPEGSGGGSGSASRAAATTNATTAAAAAGAVPAAQKVASPRGAVARRSGVLRCAVQLSRSLYGDAAALHIFRAACACVTEAHVSVPVSQLSAEAEEGPKRRRRRVEDGGERMEQTCNAAVRVARVEHVTSSRRRS